MYESFFELQKRPFPSVPSVDFYYPFESIEHARQTLIRTVDRAEGPALLIGPAGTGKSLLCQLLARHFKDRFAVAMLSSARLCTRRALLQNLLFELNLPYRDMEEGELRLSLIDHLEPRDDGLHGMLLLVDEAHTLPLRLLEEIRMITNLVRDQQPRVRLVLAGAPPLEERFASPRLESFNQRIAARCYLQSMNREETRQYVRTHIEVAGGNPEQILNEDALQAVFHATDGIPRLVNQLLDHALMMASLGGHRLVEATGVEESWADLQQLPTPWHGDQTRLGQEATIIEFGQLDEHPAGADQAQPCPEEQLADQQVNEGEGQAEEVGGERPSCHTEPIAESQTNAEPAPTQAEDPVFKEAPETDEPIAPLAEQLAPDYDDEIDDPDAVTSEGAAPDASFEEPDLEQVAVDQLEQIEAKVAQIQHDTSTEQLETADEEEHLHSGQSSSEPVTEEDDPFGGSFAEEEVIIDHYASLESGALQGGPHVSSPVSREVAVALTELTDAAIDHADPFATQPEPREREDAPAEQPAPPLSDACESADSEPQTQPHHAEPVGQPHESVMREAESVTAEREPLTESEPEPRDREDAPAADGRVIAADDPSPPPDQQIQAVVELSHPLDEGESFSGASEPPSDETGPPADESNSPTDVPQTEIQQSQPLTERTQPVGTGPESLDGPAEPQHQGGEHSTVLPYNSQLNNPGIPDGLDSFSIDPASDPVMPGYAEPPPQVLVQELNPASHPDALSDSLGGTSPQTPVAAPAGDDRDLIVVDELPGSAKAATPPGRARRQEYRSLFGKLRRD